MTVNVQTIVLLEAFEVEPRTQTSSGRRRLSKHLEVRMCIHLEVQGPHEYLNI